MIRILGSGGGPVLKRVGNLAARASGARLRLRFVDVVERFGDVARWLAVRSCLAVGKGLSLSLSSSSALASSSMLSLSSWSDCPSPSSSGGSSSSFSLCRLMRSTSTLRPIPSSTTSFTSSHSRFRSRVRGTLSFSLSSLNRGSFASCFFRAKRSSRRCTSNARFRFTCKA